ncbi:UNVERIFIED_CONTAM: hypothetical protein FKN15_044427 [Acipenser sinensis]
METAWQNPTPTTSALLHLSQWSRAAQLIAIMGLNHEVLPQVKMAATTAAFAPTTTQPFSSISVLPAQCCQ